MTLLDSVTEKLQDRPTISVLSITSSSSLLFRLADRLKTFSSMPIHRTEVEFGRAMLL